MRTLTLLTLALATLPASADILAGWDFEGFRTGDATMSSPFPWKTTDITVPSLSDTNPGYNDANLEVVVMTAVNLSQTSQDNFYRFSGWDNANTAPADISSSHANYMEWTIEPTGGHKFSLDATDTFVGSVRAYTLTNQSVLRSSLDGYTSNLDVVVGGGTSGSYSLDVGSGFTDLTGPVTFRLYVCDPDTTTSNWTWRPDENVASGALSHLDLIINGTIVPIPEPATMGLLALGGVALLRRRR